MLVARTKFPHVRLVATNWEAFKYKVRLICLDVAIIGGGIIGTAIARQIKKQVPHLEVAIIEKECSVGKHQSSSNSNVIHAGIYYKPNSLKAKLCVKGLHLIYEYCESKQIAVNKCGKLIIAQNSLDSHRLKHLHKQSIENGVEDVELLKNFHQIKQIQPFCRGVEALWSPSTGNVNWQIVTENLAKDFENLGGEILLESEVCKLKENTNSASHPVEIEFSKAPKQVSGGERLLAKYVIICAGLNSGKFLQDNCKNSYKHMSLRVKYSLLNPKLEKFVKTNIYAMPVVGMPFLGPHITPKCNGEILLGPSAVPAFKKEGYRKNDIDQNYVGELLKYPGFYLMVVKNFWVNFDQFLQTACNDVLASELQKYFPMICENDILEGPSAAQAQLMDENGDFVDDFVFEFFQGEGIRKRVVDCKFVPSPGATSSLAIAEMVCEELKNVL